MAHKWTDWPHHPCRMGGPQRFRARDKIRSGPQAVGLATSLMPYGRSPTPQKGGENHKWPTNGRIGYITPAVWGVTNALERGTKSEVAHKWTDWLHHPCRMGGPQHFRARDKIRSGPHVDGLATSLMPYGRSPTPEKGGENHKWPTNGRIGYITPAAWGVPNALERGTKSEVAHKCADWLHHPCRMGVPNASEGGGKSQLAHKWADWLHHTCRMGGLQHFRAKDKIRSGPQVDGLATSPLPYGGSPTL